MGSRRKAREFALQLLFQEDAARNPPGEITQLFWRSNRADRETRRFAETLFEKYLGNRGSVDQLISRHARNWKIDRMAAVDRSVLRMAVCEFLHGQTPPVVVIDEAIEVARKFGGEESSVFVNGVLDSIRRELEAEGPA